MANVFHIFRKGLQLRNWKMIEEVFTDLTGEAAPAPDKILISNPELIVYPEEQATPAPQPPKNEMEPCCDCGESYPRSELLAGEVLCSKCRAKPNRLDGKPAASPPTTATEEKHLVLGTVADLKDLETSSPILEETEDILDEIIEDQAATPPVPAHRVNLDQFRVEAREPSRQRSEGGNYAKTEPVRPMEGNDFLDDLSEATRELKQDQILFEKGVRPAQRTVENRNPPGMVNAKCRECGESKPIPAGEARTRKQVSSDQGGGPSFLCDGCISSKAKGRRGG